MLAKIPEVRRITPICTKLNMWVGGWARHCYMLTLVDLLVKFDKSVATLQAYSFFTILVEMNLVLDKMLGHLWHNIYYFNPIITCPPVSEIVIDVVFLISEMHVNVSFGKWRPFCSGIDGLGSKASQSLTSRIDRRTCLENGTSSRMVQGKL